MLRWENRVRLWKISQAKSCCEIRFLCAAEISSHDWGNFRSSDNRNKNFNNRTQEKNFPFGIRLDWRFSRRDAKTQRFEFWGDELRCNLPAEHGKPIIQVRGEEFLLREITGNFSLSGWPQSGNSRIFVQSVKLYNVTICENLTKKRKKIKIIPK